MFVTFTFSFSYSDLQSLCSHTCHNDQVPKPSGLSVLPSNCTSLFRWHLGRSHQNRKQSRKWLKLQLKTKVSLNMWLMRPDQQSPRCCSFSHTPCPWIQHPSAATTPFLYPSQCWQVECVHSSFNQPLPSPPLSTSPVTYELPKLQKCQGCESRGKTEELCQILET